MPCRPHRGRHGDSRWKAAAWQTMRKTRGGARRGVLRRTPFCLFALLFCNETVALRVEGPPI